LSSGHEGTVGLPKRKSKKKRKIYYWDTVRHGRKRGVRGGTGSGGERGGGWRRRVIGLAWKASFEGEDTTSDVNYVWRAG